MDKLRRELIAIGATVTANCFPCFRFHLGRAREAGASEEEIAEAVRIGRNVRRGAAATWDEEVAKTSPRDISTRSAKNEYT